MKAGFHEIDITPRVGVGLSGFGPFLNRMSSAVRDPLKARAAAFELDGTTAIMVSCDLIGLTRELIDTVKNDVSKRTGIPTDHVMIQCTHTHSGPNTGGYVGWGNIDEPYLTLLPGRIANACCGAVERLHEVVFAYTTSPCEGIGLNREHDKDAPPLADVLRDDWHPAKPELTDTRCHVMKFTDATTGQLDGFMAYFGCHPVVCCAASHYIHGDFVGVAMNLLEREHPGSVGLFLQGAQGDVNSCVVHKSEQESLLALDVIAARFANAVRAGLSQAEVQPINNLQCLSRMQTFTARLIPLDRLNEMIAEQTAIATADGASDQDDAVRMANVLLCTLRRLAARIERGEDLSLHVAEIQGIRLGPITFLGAPFEIMQPIKNEVISAARAEVPLVMGQANGSMGYAPDRAVAARGGYAADFGPIITGRMPYLKIHDELAAAFLAIDAELNR